MDALTPTNTSRLRARLRGGGSCWPGHSLASYWSPTSEDLVEQRQTLADSFGGVGRRHIRRARRTHLDAGRDRRGDLGGAEMAERFLAAAREASIETALNFLGALVIAGLESLEQRDCRRHRENI